MNNLAVALCEGRSDIIICHKYSTFSLYVHVDKKRPSFPFRNKGQTNLFYEYHLLRKNNIFCPKDVYVCSGRKA